MALAEKVLGMRRQRTKGTERGAARVYVLSGVLHCHECGQKLWGRGRSERDRFFYFHPEGPCRAGAGSFDALEVEGQVLGVLDGLVVPAELQEMVRERVRRRMAAEPDNREVGGVPVP